MSRRTIAARAAAAVAVAVWIGAGYFAVRKLVPLHPPAAVPVLTRADVERVIARIQVIRQLKFKRPVHYRFLTTRQALAILRAEEKRHGDQAQDRLAARIGIMLGLYPPGTDPEMASMRVLRRQLGGFYDFDRKELVVIKGAFAHSALARSLPPPALREMTLMVLAHELTHALQDQNFGLGAKLNRVQNKDDPQLALRAVAEGDATIAGVAYLAGGMNDAVANTLVAHIPDMYRAFNADTRDVPKAIAETFLFQYTDGARFVAQAYKRGGWKAVDALYGRPPTATQQIFDPAIYFDSRAPVPVVRVSGYQTSLAKWKKLDSGTYGELGLRELIAAAIGKSAADSALAKSWAGDRAVALGNGGRLAVIWMLAFRGEPAAQTFAANYAAALQRIHGSRVGHRVERHGRVVLAILGLAPARADRIAPAIWAQSTVSAPPPVVLPPPARARLRRLRREGLRGEANAPGCSSWACAFSSKARSFPYVARSIARRSGIHATASISSSCRAISPPAHCIRKYSTRLKIRVSGPPLRSRHENT